MKYGQSDPYVGTYAQKATMLSPSFTRLLLLFLYFEITNSISLSLSLSLSLKFDVCVIVAVVVVVSFKELFLQRKRVEK